MGQWLLIILPWIWDAKEISLQNACQGRHTQTTMREDAAVDVLLDAINCSQEYFWDVAWMEFAVAADAAKNNKRRKRDENT